METIIIPLIIFFSLVAFNSKIIIEFIDAEEEINTPESFEDFFNKTVKNDPNFVQAKNSIMEFSKGKTTAREKFHEGLAKKLKDKGLIYNDQYHKFDHIYDRHILDFTPPKFDKNGNIDWKYTEDLNIYKKVNDMQFIDLNKQAQNEGIQNQNFAEMVYMLEEYISMLHNYPDQIHSVAEIQRKAIFEKFIILKK